MNKKILSQSAALLSFSLLAGCVSYDVAVPVRGSESSFDDAAYPGKITVYNQNTDNLTEYRVYHRPPTGFTELQRLRETTFAEAGRTCATLGGTPLLLRETASQPPHILGNWPRIEIVFVCQSARR
jgi:hypothetical protein